MEIADQGILVNATPYGDADMVARILTKNHGLHAGLIKGGNSRRKRSDFEIGGTYSLIWRARLPENLGSFSLEPLGPLPSARLLDDRERLIGLQSLCQLLSTCLTDREPLPSLYHAVETWLNQLEDVTWVHTLALIELRLLSILGFGLDLSKCASTGQTDDLVYVSPRSGRAVSAVAGEPYKHKLLNLPKYLIGEHSGYLEEDARDALLLTGRFLNDRVYAARNQELPWARRALINRLSERIMTE